MQVVTIRGRAASGKTRFMRNVIAALYPGSVILSAGSLGLTYEKLPSGLERTLRLHAAEQRQYGEALFIDELPEKTRADLVNVLMQVVPTWTVFLSSEGNGPFRFTADKTLSDSLQKYVP